MKNQVIVPIYVFRVFHIKLQSLLDDLTKRQVLGKVVAYTAMEEDQKRGLPHCHILLIMADESKPRQPSDFDKITSAEIPNPATNPTLHRIVTSSLCHGPCGPVNPASPCMVAKKPAARTSQRNLGSTQCLQMVCIQNTDGGHPRMVVKLTA